MLAYKTRKKRFKQGVFINDGFFNSIQGVIIEKFINFSITALMLVHKNDENRYKKRKKLQKTDKKSQKNDKSCWVSITIKLVILKPCQQTKLNIKGLKN